jgi:predicted flap endonuclease-1-like 5' DNA nuclease
MVGGIGGQAFDNYMLPAGAHLKEIHVLSEKFVNALQFVYITSAGERGHLGPIGSVGGNHDVFVLEDGEYLTGISGLSDWYVDQICFHTNKRISAYYGGTGTTKTFALAADKGSAVVGLFGRADWYLDAIGIISRPVSTPTTATLTAPVASVPTGLSISYIEFDPPGKDIDGEYVQITNTGAPVDLTGWVLHDEADKHSYTFPSFTIGANSTIQLWTKAGSDDATNLYWGNRGAIWNNTGDTALLVDASGTEISRFSYTPETKAPKTLVARVPRPEDLEKVEGIGPKIAQLLIDGGIYDLADLAVAPLERVKEILKAAGSRFAIADPTTWSAQAELGAKGDWAGMEAMQKELSGGRKA